ncbi:MAG: hypothetical protein ABI831_18440 [Betaproteobacteria bacterium]
MKDNILNSILIAATFAAILVSAIDLGPVSQATTVRADRVPVTEKTVGTAKRPQADVVVTDADVAMVSLDKR